MVSLLKDIIFLDRENNSFFLGYTMNYLEIK
jgi:hypothetical protein